jgi:Mn2+/Fe2+ NRAMP family transporter
VRKSAGTIPWVTISPISMLFWSGVVNGVLAAPLVVLVVLLTSDHTVMGKCVNESLLRGLGWAVRQGAGSVPVSLENSLGS